MADNWVANLDMLSANGIIDYDAAAYLRGTPPRYIGNPSLRTQPQPLPPTGVAPMRPPIGKDTFDPADKPLIENPFWKKALFVLVAGGTLIFGGIKLKNAKPLKNIKPIKWVKTQCSNFWNWIKKPFSKKKKP